MAELREQFFNVMEELVMTEAISRVAAVEVASDCTLDLGDIVAYALNRLPLLYVVMENGESYQPHHAKDDLQNLIIQQVGEAIDRNLDQPNPHPERQSLGKSSEDKVLSEVSNLLQKSNTSELLIEEYIALDRLMEALLTGEVVIGASYKQFINVMEELVLTEATSKVAAIEESSSNCTLELGDIAVYALNHLPPLYATTEEGATYQRHRAKDDLHGLIAQQVGEAIARNLD